MSDSNELNRALGRLEGKIDQILQAVADHAERIDALERSKAWLLGAAAALGVVLGFIAKVVTK